MNIGVVFNQEKQIGGVYQYALSFLQALVENEQHGVTIFNESKDFHEKYTVYSRVKVINLYKENITGDKTILSSSRKKFFSIIRSFLASLLFRTRVYSVLNNIFSRKEKDFIRMIRQSKVDLLFFLTTDYRAVLAGVPFVATIHDLAHIFCPQFPEVSINGIKQFRDYSFSQVAKKAYRVLSDSEIGREDIAHYYKVDINRVVPLQLVPPNYLKEDQNSGDLLVVKEKFNLPEKFLFYPAQFWPHKNHINIVRAISELKKQGILVNVAFTGDKKEDYGEYNKVFNYVKENNLSEQVFYLGYVSNLEISALYKLAVALIMPTFFGPTNIPILEAWKMGCPVIYSGIRGCKDQAGDAALLVDPTDCFDMAEKIKSIWSDNDLRISLVKKGSERLIKWTYNDFKYRIYEIIKSFEVDNLKLNN